MTLVIKAFVSFQTNKQRNHIAASRRLIPTKGDLLLSALQPFRDSEAVKVRVYDLETLDGRLMGILNSVSETPVVIIAGERHVGLEAVKQSLKRISGIEDV